MSFPVLLKNMVLLILTFGIGFTAGSYCTYKGEEIIMENGYELDLEEWR